MAFEGVQKNVISCNWKLAVDNLFDYYHVQITHASAFMTTFSPGQTPARRAAQQNPQAHRVILGEYGHGIGGPRISDEEWAEIGVVPSATPQTEDWRKGAAAEENLGEVAQRLRGQPNIFPNLWLTGQGYQFSLRLPKGPYSTEIWWFTFVDKTLSEDDKRARARINTRAFGPAGMLEQDDGENWDQSTRATAGVIARRYPLNFQMNLRRGEPTISNSDVPYIDTAINEHGQLWTYLSWAEWMDAGSWAELRANHSLVPRTAF